jgi:hypothetical protein
LEEAYLLGVEACFRLGYENRGLSLGLGVVGLGPLFASGSSGAGFLPGRGQRFAGASCVAGPSAALRSAQDDRLVGGVSLGERARAKATADAEATARAVPRCESPVFRLVYENRGLSLGLGVVGLGPLFPSGVEGSWILAGKGSAVCGCELRGGSFGCAALRSG